MTAALLDFLTSFLFQALLLGTLLAGLTWALLSCLRHARPAVHASFWVIVLLKFVLPAGPGFDLSLSTLISRLAPDAAGRSAAARPITPPGASGNLEISLLPADLSAASVSAARTPGIGLAALLACAYLAGLALVASLRLRAYVRFARAARLLPLADAATTALVARLAAAHGLRPAITVRVCGDAAAPYIFNAIRPQLVLARRDLDQPDVLETVVLHELAHLRRGDLLVRYLQWFAGTLMYFWPVVAWVNRRIDLARERACDEWALRHGPLSAVEYARRLLAAADVRTSWQPFAPAAMAASSQHVERRIDMILNSHAALRRSRMLQFTAAAGVLGWAAFALTGAAAPAVSSGDDSKPCVRMVQGMPLDGAACAGTAHQVMVFATDGEDGAPPKRLVLTSMSGGDEARARFLTTHPQADLDADGSLSQDEYAATLAALALRAAPAVIAQYPKADRNQDGSLAADEAARLVTVGELPRINVQGLPLNLPGATAHVIHAGGASEIPADVLVKLPADVRARIAAARSSDKHGTCEVRVATSGGDEAAAPQRATLRIVRTPDGTTTETQNATGVWVAAGPDVVAGVPAAGVMLKLASGFEADGMSPSPQTWIAQNVDIAIPAAEISAQLEAVRQAPLRQFFEMHPDADENSDGAVSTAERDAFVEKNSLKMREHMLAKFPDADANKDGVLSSDELKSHFRTLHATMRPAADPK
jgi:beta-lactamase regulating signal transducer with metallopeptidase domain